MEPLIHQHLPSRRSFLGVVGASWLTSLGTVLAREAEQAKSQHAKSMIILWMEGGPSQLETFDPHPGTSIAAGTRAIDTTVKGIQLATGFERTAERMSDFSIVRSMVSKEGDHERASYNLKTGFRPDPTVVHPSIGAICCHELAKGTTDIPRHVSILPGQWPGRGGYLGEKYDAFLIDEPGGPVPDAKSYLSKERDEKRLRGVDVLESTFAKGRANRVESTQHRATMAAARTMMTSEQLAAFDLAREPLATKQLYGDTPFGRGCLVARRLIEVGVRCVEITLNGWDTHVNNHDFCRTQLRTLDPAFAGLLTDLKQRNLLDQTVVMCGGEFGRTPRLNPGGGRDHWPTGFSIALTGGRMQRGRVVGETDPDGGTTPKNPVKVADLHATLLSAIGVDPDTIRQTPIGRTVKNTDNGRPIPELLSE
jgi:Protein of unknown function (DUF1501)